MSDPTDPNSNKTMESFQKLLELVRRLRGEGGCPWDREQTLENYSQFVLEEAGELLEAVESGQWDHVREELGDTAFTILAMMVVAEEEGAFSPQECMDAIREKMVRRHPHVFGDVNLDTSEEVLDQWRRIKEEEHKPRNKEE